MPTAVMMSARWPIFLSLVRPERISSPMTSMAAVTIFGHGPRTCVQLRDACLTVRHAARRSRIVRRTLCVASMRDRPALCNAVPRSPACAASIIAGQPKEKRMAKVLVLYYSSWGHMERWPRPPPKARRKPARRRRRQARAGTGAGRRRQGRRTTSSTRKAPIADPTGTRRTTTRSSSASPPAMARWPRS